MAEDFYFALDRKDMRTVLRLQGSRHLPDFRRYTGARRELLREFLAKRRELTLSLLDFEDPDAETDRRVLFNPPEKLLKGALAAGLLRMPGGGLCRLAEGNYCCALRLRDINKNEVEASLALVDDAGTLTALAETGPAAKQADGAGGQTGLPPAFYAAAPGLVVAGDTLYPVDDLGLRWAETALVYARFPRANLAGYISLIFSGFSNLELSYEGWQVKTARPAAALPGILFMEIDAYGYLHLRPISFLRGFPPLFLENEDIVTVAEIDETEKSLGIAEVVFPESPEEEFRQFLLRGRGGRGRGRKSADTGEFYEENGRFILAPDFAGAFIGESIIELSRRFVLLETGVLAGYKLNFAKPKITLSLNRKNSMGRGIDYLGGSAAVEIGGQTFSFAQFMAEYRRASFITLSDGTRSFPDKRTMDRLDRLVSKIKGEAEVELSWFDIPLLLQDEAIQVEGAVWEDARPFFTGYNTIAQRRGAWPLEGGELRPYQEYGVRWLDYLGEYRMGACLADEMGLGKTIQVIALLRGLRRRGENGPCLILCPKSLVHNWAAELDRFAPELPYLVHYGQERDAGEITSAAFTIILSTYATLRRDIEAFKDMEFHYVILDESQNIKNLSSQTAAAVLALRSQRRIAMSGTPVENNLGELYSLFRFLNPGFFGTEQNFVRRYQKPIQDDTDAEALRDLRARIYPFMLRRLKKDVLKELPEKTEEIAFIDLEEGHLSLYHRRRQEYKLLIDGIIAKGEAAKSSLVMFKALMELRRLASIPEAEGEYPGPSAKRLYLLDRIAEITGNGHKCLVFTNFLAGVDMVSRDLAERGIGNITMTGATADRQSLVRRFQSDRAVKAFIMTLKTGGSGLNLTAADYIFILDPWWNSAAEAQAVDRSHRIGQVNPVFCFRLIARDTIEERIVELQKRKSDLAGALLADDAGALKSLSPEDVAYLVGGP